MQPGIGAAAAAGPVGSPLWQRFTRQYQHLLSRSRRTRRALVRRWGLSLAGIALALTLGLAGPSAAAPPPGILVNGFSCGLADAITTANTDTATNGCIGYGYYDTIILQDNLVLSGLLPTITTDLTVDGQNAYYISGNDQFRIFTVAATGSLTVQNITLQNGYAPDNNINTPEGIDARRGGAIFTEGALTVTNSTIKDTRANIQGGAVHFYPHYSNPATLTITDSQFANNQSLDSSGGAVFATNFTQLTITGSSTFTNNYANNQGGALYVRYGSSTGPVSIENSTFDQNSAYNDGGALYLGGGGTATITGTTFNGNDALDRFGGAIYAYSNLTVNDSIFDQNHAQYGGGAIYHQGDRGSYTIAITDSTFSANTSSSDYGYGGALWLATGVATITGSDFSSNTAYKGGAIYSNYYLTVNTSTFAGNTAQYHGGAIFQYYYGLTVNDSTFSNNTATDGRGGAIASYYVMGNYTPNVINGSTFAGNQATSGGAIASDKSVGTVTNSTFYVNFANGGPGGALRQFDTGTLTIVASTITGNLSATYGGGIYAGNSGGLSLTGSVVSGNESIGGGPEIGLVFDGGSTTQYSVIGQDNDPGIVGTLGGSYTVPGAGVYASDLLAPLGDNSGPTFTMLPISPLLVDAVPSDNAFRADSCFGGLTTDQRGAVRPYDSTAVAGNGCDIGAVETQAPNAIELATLTANALPSGGVRIVWETASEIDSAGFNVLRGRSADGSDRLAVNGSLIAATGSNGIGAEYTFDDTTAGVGTWYYWLEEIDTQGNATRHGPVSADVRVPTAVTLRNIGGSQGIGLVWGAISLVVATLVAFFRARRNDFSRFLRDGWKGRTTKVVTTNYAAPSVETVEMQDFASLLGAARAFSPRGWEDEL